MTGERRRSRRRHRRPATSPSPPSDAGPRRPAQGPELRAGQPDLALRRRPGGLRGRRQRPHHDDRRRPRHPDPVRRLLGQPAHRCRRQRRGRRHLRPAGGRRRPPGPPPSGRPGHDLADRPRRRLRPGLHRAPDRRRLDLGHDRRPDSDHAWSWRPSSPASRPTTTPYLVENELLGAVHVLQAMTPATLQETLAMAQASLGNGSTIDFGLVDGDGGAAAAPRPDLEARVRRVPPGQPRVRRRQQLVGAERRRRAERRGERHRQAAAAAAAERGGDARPDRQHPGRRDRRPRSTSASQSRRRRPHRRQHRPGQRRPRHRRHDPGSFHAGFGVEATGSDRRRTRPSIARLLHQRLRHRGHQRRRDCDGAAEILCADFPVYVSDAKPPGGNLTVTTTLGDGDDLQDVFTGTSTTVVLPSGCRRSSTARRSSSTPWPRASSSTSSTPRPRCAPRRTTARCPSSARTSRPAPTSWARPARRSTTSSRTNGDPSTVGGARTLLTDDSWPSELGIVVNGADRRPGGLHLQPRPSSRRPAPTGDADAAPSPADTTEYLYKVVSDLQGRQERRARLGPVGRRARS